MCALRMQRGSASRVHLPSSCTVNNWSCSCLIVDIFILSNVSSAQVLATAAWKLSAFAPCARGYLYLRTRGQMVWERDLSCMVVRGQTPSQHSLVGLHVLVMLYNICWVHCGGIETAVPPPLRPIRPTLKTISYRHTLSCVPHCPIAHSVPVFVVNTV